MRQIHTSSDDEGSEPTGGKNLDEAVLLRAIAGLKDELITILNTGIAQVQKSVAALEQQQTDHLLSQERRNSSFASREHVETIAAQVATNSGEITRLHAKDEESSTDRKDLHAIIIANEHTATTTRIANLTKGYAAIGAGLIALAGVLAQFFFHFWK